MFLTLTVSANAWADYTIAFKSADGADGSAAQTTIASLISSGGTNVSTISATRAYNGKSGYGIKLGSSSSTGNVIMTLANSAQIKASKLVVKAAYYDSNKTLKVTVTYTDNTTTTQTITPASSPTDYDVSLTDTKTIKQIKIESVTASKGRMYCHSIKVVAASAASSYTVTATSNNNTYGTVSVSGTTITASPKTGYTYANPAYTVTFGTAIVTQNGNTFTVTPSTNCTIRINFEAKPKYTVTWNVNGSKKHSQTEVQGTALTDIPVPTTLDCDGEREFVGWTTQPSYEHATNAPTDLITNTIGLTMPENGANYYAVFAKETKTTGGTTTTPTTATLSFANKDQRTTYTTSQQVWKQNGITLTNDKGSSTSNVGDYSNPARFYKSSKITLSFTYAMTQIVFTCSSSEYATDLKNSIKSGATVTASGSTVTAELTEPATSFVISSLSGQVRMNSVEVTYESSTQGAQTTTYSDYTTSCTTEPSQLATPTGLNVTNITSTSATLSWGAVTNASGYKVTVVDGNSYNKTISVEKNNTSITLDDLTQLTAYSWTVIAIGDGTNYTNSDESETSEFTTQKACTDAVNVNKGKPNNGSFTMVSGYQSTCNGPVTVTLNDIQPDAGYQFSTITQSGVDAANVTINNTAKTVTYAQHTSGNSTINVTFTPAVYTITYNTNGGNTIAATSGTTLPNPLPTTTKTGYTFAGWYTDEGCTQAATAGAQITKNTTLYAKWTINSYTLTWDVNGGNDLTGTYTSGSVEFGATITKPADPTREGHVFKGWHNGTSIVTPAATMPANDLTYTAQWTQLRTITWKVAGEPLSGDALNGVTTQVENNTKITAIPNDPNDNTLNSCGANEFMGWSIDNIGSTPDVDAPTDLFTTVAEAQSKIGGITKNKTFYAVFATSKETTGGTVEASLSFASTAQRDSQTSSKQVWSNEGITFTNNKGSSTTDVANYSNPVRLYKNSEIIVGHTSGEITKIVFDCNSSAYATALKNSIGTPNSNTTVTTSSDKVTVTFANAVASFSAKLTSDQVRLDALTVTAGGGTITTYSNYVTNCCELLPVTNLQVSGVTEKSATLTWTKPSSTTDITELQIRNADNDAVVVDDINPTTTTATIDELDECTKYNYYVVSVGAECEVSSETITAQPFSGAKTVTFNYNGNGQANTTSSTSCNNTSITLPTPTWAGYRFMGWFTAANGGTEIDDNPYTPTEDIPLYAHWAKEYSVTYNANGGSTTCAGGAYIAGETVTVCTTNPSKTGHTFTGWTYSPNVTITDGKFVMPASDVTITAQWTINQYTVTWNPNGGNWAGSTENIVHTYDYGATINRPADPTRDEYRFTGWKATVASTMPATNITYTAQWKQNYTITFHDGDDTTPWTQAKDAESINLTEYVGTLACDDYQFAGWSTDATQYNDQTANITTWVTGTYTPAANIHLYAVYVKGDLATDFTLNCDGGVYEIWEKGHNQHMAGRQNGSGNQFYTTEYWDANNSESNGAPFTITKVADNTYTLQNADGQYITRDSYDGNADELEIKDTWENADRYKWIISNGTNGTWRFTNKAATSYALVYYNNKYFELRSASSVTAGNTTTYDLELTPAASNVYQSNPNCGPYTITFETGGGEFIQGNYKYSTQKTSNLTEPTNSKFPAAELDGYTFAGWKDGSPQEDINYEPYLKKADDNLVVSSNKTYYAVYYYYDEEEDIDWSKEFTTAIYADVNGIKYFLAGAPNGGTMSSTTDCGYVSEVTITPGTGANAGKYKITVNGIAMAPEANETHLLNGTYWWTITERSVGSGEYKISGQDKKNIVLRNSSWGHYTYNQGSEYGNGYYYPHFGKCLQHHWTSNPTPKPSIKLSGDVYVTATNGRGIMATQSLSVAANNLYAGESLTLSSESIDVYFSAERNVNFVKADKPTASLTLTADATGKIDKEVYVHYKPSTEGDGVPADVVVTATASSVSKNYTIHVRNLSAKFVIATKVGATWYALPADMSSATNPLGVVIEVDETTMTTIAPNTTTYTLWPVKTTATENDRYTNVTGAAYGDRVRFAAVNYEQRGLWANNNNNGSTIRNYAVINSLGGDGLAGYEWKITTTVVDGHWQYTLQTDQDKNQNFLRYWTSAEGTPVGPKWGTYNAGENKLYFLPVTETHPFEYAVVEWYPTKVLIQTDAAITSPTVKVDGEAVASPILTNKGGKLYEISNLPLETNPNKLLQISFTDNAINYTNTKVVPIILSRGEKTITGEPFATLTQKVYQYTDVVVRDGATLSVDGTTDVANTLLGVTIYPTAKVSVAEGKKLSVHSLTFFGGIDEIYDGSAYTINKYGVPQLSLMGTLGKTVTTMDYIMRVNLDQMYQVGVPYDVNLNEITYWDGSAIKLGDELYVSAYDGQARANLDLKNTWIWEVNFAEKVLKAGIGYTISAEPQVAGDIYSILRMPMKDNIASGNTEESKQVPVIAYANQHSVQIADNHKGWNYLSNPYMTAISGGEADTKLVLGYLKETGTGPWEWMNDEIRYVTIPHDDGEDYDQKKFSEAELKPFKSFFVQIAQGGELSFALASRQNAPARSIQAAIEKEVEFEILMSNDARQDNTGLLIAEQYSPAYEINADLEKMIGSMSVYTIYGGYNLAYNAISPINASEWIPMGYIAPAAGEYTFRLDDIDKIVEQVEHVYLIDYEANNIVDLMDDEYEFTTDKEQNNNRFAINVVLRQDKDNTTTGLDIIQGNNAAPIKFIYHDKMYIQSGGVIYDATGKQVTNINK